MKKTSSADNLLKHGPIGIIPLGKPPRPKSIRKVRSAPDLSQQTSIDSKWNGTTISTVRFQKSFALVQDLMTYIEISGKLHQEPNVAIGEIVLLILSTTPKDIQTKTLMLLLICIIGQTVQT
tara:strand:- start:789 stop:1154 length:366 start_codon:yes stop_codon:yes gene_type:complete